MHIEDFEIASIYGVNISKEEDQAKLLKFFLNKYPTQYTEKFGIECDKGEDRPSFYQLLTICDVLDLILYDGAHEGPYVGPYIGIAIKRYDVYEIMRKLVNGDPCAISDFPVVTPTQEEKARIDGLLGDIFTLSTMNIPIACVCCT